MAATFEFAQTVTVTSSAQTVSFGLNANYVRVVNSGTSYVHISFDGVTATTSASFEFRNGDTPIELRPDSKQGYITSVSMRTPSTNNGTIRILALGKGIST